MRIDWFNVSCNVGAAAFGFILASSPAWVIPWEFLAVALIVLLAPGCYWYFQFKRRIRKVLNQLPPGVAAPPVWAVDLFQAKYAGDLKAIRFLFSVLSQDQILCLKHGGYFTYTGQRGNVYRFGPLWRGVWATLRDKRDLDDRTYIYDSSVDEVWGCVWTHVSVPIADGLATLLLWLKANERHFVRQTCWSVAGLSLAGALAQAEQFAFRSRWTSSL